jgi:serine/threonine protein phosphatase PrpC
VFGLGIWMSLDLPCHGKSPFSLPLGPYFLECLSLVQFQLKTSSLNFTLIRSLGDAVAHTAGVISDPEFTEKELDPSSDRVIVVATDGLWEFVDNDETIELLFPTPGPAEAVDCLVKEANARWMQEEQVIDDTTIIVAHLFDYKSSEE